MMSSVTIERKRVECNSLPKGWQREEIIRKSGISAGKMDVCYYSRTMRSDVSLVPPIRQTASIFKQPVTVIRNHEVGKVKHDAKHAAQDKPKQMFWEKRLERLRACHSSGEELEDIILPRSIRSIGPNVNEQTVLHSLATALHILSSPVTGQTSSKTEFNKNATAFINPDQPLMQSVLVSEDDIRRQEDRVNIARKKLQDALKS
ncbi:methyl-CpG-binding domain protein 2 isoform X2 [Teleopsis dalmanni]|uniref:methyl-CpG-binding domain protein 2 isoform X2 n=1 Tax=Teleopsis dalmanni TaxID=139649 RepID=UPI0018CD7A1C|nr:methyl-CpG-binding domain protein 2 isoform X2 [Teleopsis dalmanni]